MPNQSRLCDRCGKPTQSGVLLGNDPRAANTPETPETTETNTVALRWKCLRCALIDGPLLRRSGRVAIVVGTILVALNQGDQLVAGTFPFESSWWKLPLTFAVPFCVATYGALSNGYRPSPPTPLSPADTGPD